MVELTLTAAITTKNFMTKLTTFDIYITSLVSKNYLLYL